MDAEAPAFATLAFAPDDPRVQAFLHGPVVLAGDLGDRGLTDAHIVGPNLQVTFLPLSRLFDRRYSVYWEVA